MKLRPASDEVLPAPSCCGHASIAAELAADTAAGYGQERLDPDAFFAEIEHQRHFNP